MHRDLGTVRAQMRHERSNCAVCASLRGCVATRSNASPHHADGCPKRMNVEARVRGIWRAATIQAVPDPVKLLAVRHTVSMHAATSLRPTRSGSVASRSRRGSTFWRSVSVKRFADSVPAIPATSTAIAQPGLVPPKWPTASVQKGPRPILQATADVLILCQFEAIHHNGPGTSRVRMADRGEAASNVLRSMLCPGANVKQLSEFHVPGLGFQSLTGSLRGAARRP